VIVAGLRVRVAEQQQAIEQQIEQEAERHDGGDRRRRIMRRGQLDRVRKQVEEGNRDDGARAEAEDEVQAVAQAERDRAAEHRRGERELRQRREPSSRRPTLPRHAGARLARRLARLR
jgi:hypothetical protein